MRRILTFDAYASAFDVAQEASLSLRGMPGVLAVEVLAATAGPPAFCILLETDDARDAEVGARIDATLGEYTEYLSNVSHRAYRKIG